MTRYPPCKAGKSHALLLQLPHPQSSGFYPVGLSHTHRAGSAERLAGLPFGVKYRLDFLADVLSVPFIDDIAEWGKLVVALVAIHTIVDGNEAHALF